MTDVIPFTDLRAMTGEVRDEVQAAWSGLLDRNEFIGGATVERFEQEWAAYCQTKYAVGVANGTDALRLTLQALGIGHGDEVVVPANTFVATVEAVVLAGAVPRFADVSPETLLIGADDLEAAITSRTAAVIVVQLYGQMADMDALGKVADRAGIAVVEDAAQAHGATWRDGRAGSFGSAGCFSFYPAKNLGAFGDAGAVVTNDSELARRLECLRDHGRASGSHHRHVEIGTNSRLDALQAAVLSAKLPHLDRWTELRRALVAEYQRNLAHSGVRLVGAAEEAGHVYHLAVARVLRRDAVRARLDELGIRTGIHYPIPCHRQAPYEQFATAPLPVVEQAADEVLSLPLFPQLQMRQVARVSAALRELVPGGRSRADLERVRRPAVHARRKSRRAEHAQ
jgi:dTDP-4-amino-4,6-dideoxygalactose transaminase